MAKRKPKPYSCNCADVRAVAQQDVFEEQLFPDDDRAIVGWEVSESDGQYHVTVASLAD